MYKKKSTGKETMVHGKERHNQGRRETETNGKVRKKT